jgi:hypothetical protein
MNYEDNGRKVLLTKFDMLFHNSPGIVEKKDAKLSVRAVNVLAAIWTPPEYKSEMLHCVLACLVSTQFSSTHFRNVT